MSIVRLSALCIGLLFAMSLLNCGGQECYFDTACGQGQVCKDGKCVAGSVPSCTKDSDCASGQKCYANNCVSLPKGFEFPDPNEKSTPDEPTTDSPPDSREAPVDTSEPPTDNREVPPTDQVDGGPGDRGEPIPEQPVGTPCKRDLDCASKSGELCTKSGKGLTCQTQNNKGKGLGVPCDPNAPAPGDCRSKLCHPDKYCSTPCIDDNDCPSGTGSCKDVAFPDGSVFKLCENKGNSQCFNDLQCSNTLQCIIRAVRAGIPGAQCGNGVGASGLGDACFSDSECSYNVCVNGQYCSQPCLSDSDCKAPFVCGKQSIEFPAGSGKNFEFKLCKLPPEGLVCKISGDCKVRDNKCSPRDVNGTLELRCQAPSGSKKFRETCGADKDCESNFCLDLNYCTRSCDKDSDCPSTGGLIVKCLEFDAQRGQTKGKLKSCVVLRKDCTKDSDCGTDETCAPFKDVAGPAGMKCIKRFDRSGKANNESCTVNGDCQSRRCSNNRCDACGPDTDCDTGEVCISGFCTNTKGLGKDCTKPEDCHSKICFNKTCSLACATNPDCTKSGYGCTSEALTASGESLMGQICTVPQGGLPCFTSADCPSAQTNQCTVVEVNGKPTTRCRAKVGSKANGEACAQDSDCISGACLKPDNTCTQSCAKDSDCTKDQRCLEREFTPSGGGTAVKIKVCGLPSCNGDAECPQGQICVFAAGGGTPYFRCQSPDTNKKAVGASCTQDSDCQSGLCSGSTNGVCAAPCVGGKSELCPLQLDCESTASGTSNTHLCKPITGACQSNGDCKSSEVCTLSFDAANRPVRSCKPPVGKRKTGDVCDPKAQPSLCETGYCDARTNRCARFCKSGSDCPSGPYKCSTASFAKAQGQNGPDWTLLYCRYTNCDHDGNCEKGEICQASAVQGKIAKSCVTPSGKKAGDPCTSNSDCASGMCLSSVCAPLCAANRHCATGSFCREIQLLPGLRTKGCTTGTRTTCAGNADCPQGQICQANFNTSGDPVTECKTPKATDKADGQPCTPGSFPGECASHLCDTVTKTCLKTCDPKLEQLGDCRIGKEVCQPFPVLTKTINACLPPATSCKKAADCPSGSSCAAALDQSTVSYTCQRPSAARPKQVGSVCDPGKAFPGECETGLCHPSLKVCVNTCEQDADCTNGTRTKCGGMEIAAGVFARVCIPDKAACDTDANCPSSQPVCALELSSNTLSKQCGAGGPGTKKTGEPCDPDKNIPGDCINRFCEEGTRTCVATCEKDEHCPQGLVCASTFVEKTRQAKACVKPAQATCTNRLDCPRPLACVSNRETTQIASKCQTPSGADLGSPCTPSEMTQGSKNYRLDTSCKSNICHPDTKQCTSPCQNDSDCAAGTCKTVQLEGFQVKICDATCQKDADCPTGQVCGAELDGNGDVRPLCITPAANTTAKGTTCDPSKVRYAECQSGVCGPSTSKCLALCAQDSDCGTGEICATTFARTASTTQKPVLACVPDTGSCTKQSHCITGYLCGAVKHSGNVVISCFQTTNTGNEGTVCDPMKVLPGDCHTGLCDAKSKVCTTPCETNADCTNGTRTTCGNLSVEGTNVKACIEP